MATIAENLQTILDIKNDIKSAIIAKGVSVADTDGFATYPSKIESIESGGGGTLETIIITENGVYVPSVGVDGYNQVNVNVTGEIVSLISPDTLKRVYETGYNDTGYYSNGALFYAYDGYCVENPENGEIGVPNYTYNTDYGQWDYVKDVNGNNYLTPSNFIIDKYLRENNVEIRYNNTSIYQILGGLVRNEDATSIVYLYNIDGSEQELEYQSTTYTIENYMYPTDLVNGNNYQYFHPVVKPAYIYSSYVNDIYYSYPGKRFKGGYFGFHNDSGFSDITKRGYFSDYCIVEHFYLINYSGGTTYCPIVAPELKINELNGYIKFASNEYKKVTIETYNNGFENFEYCNGLKELIINNFISGGNYFIYDCNNLETLHIEDMSALDYVYDYLFLGASNLKNISGFNNLGKGFYGYQYVKMNYLYNLTRESVINIFNGLYDMNQNPNVQTSTIILDSNSKALLSDEDIAIATNKGWVIS